MIHDYDLWLEGTESELQTQPNNSKSIILNNEMHPELH